MTMVGKRGIEDELVVEAVQRRWWPLFLKLAVSAFLVTFLAIAYDMGAAIHRLGAIDPPWFVASLLLLGLGIFLATLRWRAILGGIGIALSFRDTLRIVFIGLFFNQALPSSIGGDAMRAWQINRMVASVGLALRSVVLDRLAGLAGLIFLVLAGLPLLFGITEDGGAKLAMTGLVLGAGAGFALLLTFDRLPLVFRRGRFLEALARIAIEARKLLLASRRAPRIFGLSCSIHILSAFSVFCLAQGMGIVLGIVECLVLVPPVILLMVVPISLAGWGVREGAMIAALSFVNVPAEEALVLSIAFGLGVLLSNLPGGAVWFLTRNTGPIRQEATEE